MHGKSERCDINILFCRYQRSVHEYSKNWKEFVLKDIERRATKTRLYQHFDPWGSTSIKG